MPVPWFQRGSVKRAHEAVPWIKVREQSESEAQSQQLSVLDRVGFPSAPADPRAPPPHPRPSSSSSSRQHAQELCELRLGMEQVTERELDMAKRLEDFISQSQDQSAALQAQVRQLHGLLEDREEQLASATFRYGSRIPAEPPPPSPRCF